MSRMIKKLLASIRTYRKAISFINNTELDNNSHVPFVFQPHPHEFSAPLQRRSCTIDDINIDMPSSTNDLAYYPITHLAKLIKTRQVTSTELTTLFLSRLKKHNNTLNCVVSFTEELALSQARQADKEIAAGNYRGPLHGIPWGIKDLFAVKGYPTTWGIEAFKERYFDSDATVVQRLHDAGAVLIAKLSTGAFALGDTWFGGRTYNPWKPSEGSGGSSCGPAAAMSAGLVGFSIATETRGSITIPSMKCGVTGLRPTYGRISRIGVMTLSWSMDKVGTICSTAEDCAIVFNEIYGSDGTDRSVINHPFTWNHDRDVRKLRVGYIPEEFEFEGVIASSDMKTHIEKQNNEDALHALESLGVTLTPIKLPEFPCEFADIIVSIEGAGAFDYKNRANQNLITPNGSPIKKFQTGRWASAVLYNQINRARNQFIQQMERIMSDIDVWVTPTYVGPANWITNLTGQPAVIVPNGATANGDHVSLSFIGNHFDEETILALAHAYQSITNHHTVHPANYS